MIDETLLQTIDFEKQGGLVPAVVQDAENGQVGEKLLPIMIGLA